MKHIISLSVESANLSEVLGAVSGLADVSFGQTSTSQPVTAPTARRANMRELVTGKPFAANIPTVKRGGNRGPVVYTPAKTQKQIAAIMADLRRNSMAAFVLTDIVKHPETSKRDIIGRLASKFEKHGYSTESIDNVVWTMQNKGIVKSVAVD